MDNIGRLRFSVEYEKKTTVCPIHGEQVVNVPKGYTGVIWCPLCEEERRQAEEYADSIIARHKRYRASNIEEEYWEKSLDDYKTTTPSQKLAYEAISGLIEARRGKVVLLGANGVGKTMLGAIAIMKLGGAMYSAYEVGAMIRASYRGGESELDIVRRLSSLPCLFIDEIGRSKGSKAELDWLSYILDKRHTRGLPFILASNTHPLESCKNKSSGGCPMCFENYVGCDILSRLSQDSSIINIDAQDYRRVYKED